MLSRVAETIYWTGRYLERAENTARLIQVNTHLNLDLPAGVLPSFNPLISIVGCESEYRERHPEFTERRIVSFLISDERNPSSIMASLASARENARTIREILPREGWEVINAMYLNAQENKSAANARKGRHAYLEGIRSSVQHLTGLLAGTMNHDLAYDFLNTGRKLERADMTSRIVDVLSDSPIPADLPDLRPFEDMIWMSMLYSLSAYQMYRQTTQIRIRRNDVLRFLFCETRFPRSVDYCISEIAQRLSRLPNNDESLKLVRRLQRSLRTTFKRPMDNDKLHQYVDKLQLQLANLHNSIAQTYFPRIT